MRQELGAATGPTNTARLEDIQLVGPATGGIMGVGTINVSGGFYVNGVLVTSGGGGAIADPVTYSMCGGL